MTAHWCRLVPLQLGTVQQECHTVWTGGAAFHTTLPSSHRLTDISHLVQRWSTIIASVWHLLMQKSRFYRRNHCSKCKYWQIMWESDVYHVCCIYLFLNRKTALFQQELPPDVHISYGPLVGWPVGWHCWLLGYRLDSGTVACWLPGLCSSPPNQSTQLETAGVQS